MRALTRNLGVQEGSAGERSDGQSKLNSTRINESSAFPEGIPGPDFHCSSHKYLDKDVSGLTFNPTLTTYDSRTEYDFYWRFATYEDFVEVRALHRELFPIPYNDTLVESMCKGNPLCLLLMYKSESGDGSKKDIPVAILVLSTIFPHHLAPEDIRCILATHATRVLNTAIMEKMDLLNGNHHHMGGDLTWVLEGTGLLDGDCSALGDSEFNDLNIFIFNQMYEYLRMSVSNESLASESHHIMYIITLGTILQFRNKGIGIALVEEAKRIARQSNKSIVYLHVGDYNKAAVNLYETTGFRLYDSREDYYSIQNQRHTGLLYACEVGDAYKGYRLPRAPAEYYCATLSSSERVSESPLFMSLLERMRSEVHFAVQSFLKMGKMPQTSNYETSNK